MKKIFFFIAFLFSLDIAYCQTELFMVDTGIPDTLRYSPVDTFSISPPIYQWNTFNNSLVVPNTVNGPNPYMTLSGDKTVNSFLNLSYNNYGKIRFNPPLSLGDYTIVYQCRRDSTVYMPASSYGGVLSDSSNYNNFWLGLLRNTADNYDRLYKSYTTLNDFKWHTITHKLKADSFSLFVDGAMVYNISGISQITPISTIDVSRLAVSNFNFPGYIGKVSIYNYAQSDSQMISTVKQSTANLIANGADTALKKYYYIAEGNSITANLSGYANTFNDTMYEFNHTYIPFINFAVSGSGKNNLFIRKATSLPAALAALRTYKNVVMSVMIGTNDLADPSAYYSDLLLYIAPFRAAGVKIILCTVLPKNVFGWDALRGTYNSILRSGFSNGDFDALCDWDNTLVGLNGQATNTTYFYDGTHPTSYAHSIMSGQFRRTWLSMNLH